MLVQGRKRENVVVVVVFEIVRRRVKKRFILKLNLYLLLMTQIPQCGL